MLDKCINQMLDASNPAEVFGIAARYGLDKTQAVRAVHHLFHSSEQTMQTRKSFESQILARAFDFEAQKAGRSYLRGKEVALKAHGDQQASLIEEAKNRRATFIALMNYAPEETDLSSIVMEFCGQGRDWNASGKMVRDFADANGIDQQLAADLVGRQMTVAQDYVQAKRSVNFGRYLSWLEDAASEATGDELPANIEEIVIGAYNRAAQWNQPADGLLIREFAENMGISEVLPTWAECLKKNMPTAEQAMEARKRMSNRAAAIASAEQEAEQELAQQYGNF